MLLAIGGSGFLGPSLRAAVPQCDILFTHRANPIAGSVFFDARETPVRDLVQAAGKRVSAALILAGITNVDACARDPQGTAQVNIIGIRRTIDELRELGIAPVFTSSDAVFDGSRGMWREGDPIAPILTYGRQKLEVERYLVSLAPPWLVVRLPKLISLSADPRCMVTSWVRALGIEGRIRCATDQYFTPAAAPDIAAAMAEMTRVGAQGLFHLGGPERLSRRALLEVVIDEYRKFAQPRATIVDCSLREIPVLETRPLDTSMDSSRASAQFGVRLRGASEVAALAVRACFGAAPRK